MYSRARIVVVTAGALLLAGCGGGDGDRVTPSTIGATSRGSSATSSSATPAPRIFDAKALQDGVRQVLVQSYGLAGVSDVRCPSGQVVQTGVSFDCALQVDGAPKTVTLTVRSQDGTYQVSQPR
ncbi:DUF4333 domain-containing protein [Amycolatopsis sp.]|uniref:DUF4333 domain-containing protein n=1 Tax=Amycolatopsis sp. TaxID=37632 RepID=UPI002CA18B4A|nr:DUF4333 domain-containing protein [Amycolatopsis sp.]HVV14781.1 DUF4333 domain-containing protein [Amycolatopsis sp.]